jgi:hypothetical protein
MAIVMLVAGSVIGIAAYHHFWIVTPDGAQRYQDHFEILPKEDHNVHAIEAYGTLAVAIVSVLIALLIWRSVRVETDVLESHEQLIATNTRAITTSAIQTISFEMLKIDRWMADHPDYAKALTAPEEQESETGMAVAEVYADFIDAVISQEDLLPDDHMHAWLDYFHDIFTMWPQLRKYMNAHPDWYLEDQNRLLNRDGH